MASRGDPEHRRGKHSRGRGRGSRYHAPGSRSTSHSSVSSIRYVATGGGRVDIRLPINPWKILGLPTNATRGAIKMSFKNKITNHDRQNRAMVSLANHILTSTADRYGRKEGTDEFYIKNVSDHFVIVACGNSRELASKIAIDKRIVQATDEHGRSLLYLACKSGFYDICKLLLHKGAVIDRVQVDGSTPLHAAAYFGHSLVVGLLLECGASVSVKNKWQQTALQESSSGEITNVIQTASSDVITSLAVKLKEQRLVYHVRPIEFEGKIIAKELLRDPRSLDQTTRGQWNRILETWTLTWHGTRFKNLESIMQNGLIPAGTRGIKPPQNHFSLGRTYLGIDNWAAAIFLSPSILYSAHAAYSERVISQREQWCVLVRAYCQPGSYKPYDPTVLKYEGMEGEPDQPEYRVPVTEEDKNVILRVESARSVVVRSLVFVRANFLENEGINFSEIARLFKN